MVYSKGDYMDESEFNMAVSFLNRMNLYFYRADEASMNLQPFQWFHSLMVVYRELSTELKEEEEIEWMGEKREKKPDGTIEFVRVKTGKIELINKDIIQENRAHKGANISSKLYMDLHKFDIFIRQVLKRAGLLTKMKEDPRKAVLQR